MNAKRFYPTAIALYFTYFIHGIGVSILGQYKQDFAGVWGADKLSDGTFDVSMVIAVIAALGLGRLLTLPISGPFSDKFGRKPSALIGVALYAVYFIGLAFAPNMYIAYAFAFVGGAANSFLDTAVTPSVLEIFTKMAPLPICLLNSLSLSDNLYYLSQSVWLRRQICHSVHYSLLQWS